MNNGYSAELGAFGLEAMLGWNPAPAHCEGSVKPLTGTAIAIQAGRIERGIDDPELVILVQEGLLIRNPGLHVVNAFGIGDVRERAGIEQRALLGDGFPLRFAGRDRRRDRCWDSSCRRRAARSP